jgi:arabinogalactan endo-1,4-beta-galactosidase
LLRSTHYVGADSSDYLGSATNSEKEETSGFMMNGTKNALSKDFAYGADLSSVAEVEENGGVYYNENGQQQDVFKILAADGVNYARFRLWDNPASSDGVSYGGGHNDLKTDRGFGEKSQTRRHESLHRFPYVRFLDRPRQGLGSEIL